LVVAQDRPGPGQPSQQGLRLLLEFGAIVG
jgi:hypothetical protein